MAYLLRTERPILLEREKPAHEWWETHDPAGQFGLIYIFDNAPGDWTHYSRVFHRVWRRAHADGIGMINCESDVVPTMRAFDQVLLCPEPVCIVPNQIYAYENGKMLGHSAWVENRLRGGWESHFLKEGEDRAKIADLGFVRFGPAATALPIGEVPETEQDTGLLNAAVFEWLNVKFHTDRVIHVHWPPLFNTHREWDSGDAAHWPVGSEHWNRPRPGDAKEV